MKLFFLVSFFLFISPALCHEWRRAEEKFNYLSDSLYFRNRAACAAKSKNPTRQVLLMVDNVNVAKSAYRLAKIKGIDPLQTTNLAVEKFRYGITTLTRKIGRLLLDGSLPFVKPDDSEMNLKLNWEGRGHLNQKGDLRCRMIKKFGAFHSTLNVSKPDHFLLEELAKDLENIGETFKDCDDLSGEQSADVALYRFDVSADSSFEEKGFEFWASLKAYLSWALRFSHEVKELTAPFDSLLRNTDIEEMILLLSAGCESISAPECSARDLSLDALQDLTAPVKDYNPEESVLYGPTPDSQIDQMFSRPLPLKEDDLLHLGSFSSTEEWVENFRENFLKARGYQKIRLSRATSNVMILSLATSGDELAERLQREKTQEQKEWKQELFYLCTEFGAASSSFISSFEKDLPLLRNDRTVAENLHGVRVEDIEQMMALYSKLSLTISDICQELEQKKIWEGLEIDRKGLAPWYLYRSGSPIVLQQHNLRSSLPKSEEYIKINGSEVFCQSGIHCSRILLDSLMTISTVARSLAVVSPREVPAVNFGNPFASRVACGIYDPWEKKNKMIFNFFHDLFQAAAFGFLPSPVYVSVDVDPKRVTTFETLIKEGKVFYDPVYSKKKYHLSLISDLGPLIGIPCAVSVSGSRINPLEYYSFSGISFSGCREQGKNDIEVTTGDEIKRDVSFNQVCAACAINLRTVSSAVGHLHPALRFSSFLLKGVVRLLHARRDPHDFPRSFNVNPHHVALSYRYWGNITPWCTKKILKGKSCLPSSCERNMVEAFTAKYSASPLSSNFNCLLQKGVLRVWECKDPIYLSHVGKLKIKTDCKLSERQ